ncbi:MAG: hypothetical protein JOS17DRAFT_485518 [Linnemannia elongata]|nr:MAG: hypothetical protein JOS17DRAFT_485518 [Linnemannia elongata]
MQILSSFFVLCSGKEDGRKDRTDGKGVRAAVVAAATTNYSLVVVSFFLELTRSMLCLLLLSLFPNASIFFPGGLQKRECVVVWVGFFLSLPQQPMLAGWQGVRMCELDKREGTGSITLPLLLMLSMMLLVPCL